MCDLVYSSYRQLSNRVYCACRSRVVQVTFRAVRTAKHGTNVSGLDKSGATPKLVTCCFEYHCNQMGDPAGRYRKHAKTPAQRVIRNHFNSKSLLCSVFGNTRAAIPAMRMRTIAVWKDTLRDESGNVLVLAAVAMTGLLGFAALATDMGVLFRARRNAQTAADAAAVAGALEYLYQGTSTSATSAGKAASSLNGFTDGTDGAVVTISVPPADGPNAGISAYVEAVVTKPQKTFFMGMFGHKTMTVAGRAVAGTPTNGLACMWFMANSGTALDLQGKYDIEATSCGVYVNSTDASALSVTGASGTMNTAFLEVVGSSTSVHATSPTQPTLNAAPRKSPWGQIPGPTEGNGGCTTINTATTSITGNVTASAPGLNHAICYQKAVTLNGATLGAGVYMFEKGVTISGTVTVNGGTIDVYGGTFSQGNAILNITAPTSGIYNGIALMQPSNNTTDLHVQFGSNSQTLDGYIYAPGARVYLQDNGGNGVTTTGIVANSMHLGPSKITIPSYDKAHPSTTPNRVVSLVE